MNCDASQVLLGLSKEALSLSQKKKMTDLPTDSKNVAQEKLDAAVKQHAAAQEVGTFTCYMSSSLSMPVQVCFCGVRW